MKCLHKYGLTSEQNPKAFYQLAKAELKQPYQDVVKEDILTELSNNIDGNWNLQADAPLVHFVDYS